MLESKEKIVRKYQFLSNTSMDDYWIFDTTGRILFANRGLSQMHGYSVEEMAGKYLRDFEAAEDEAALQAHLAKIMEQGPDRFESLLRHKNGSIVDVEISVAFIPEDQIFLAFTRDITRRKQAEKSLLASEARFRALFENNMDGILLTQPDGRISAANPAACAIFGMSEAEICRAGRNGLVDPADPRLAALIRERAARGTVRAECTHLRGDGSKFPAEISSVIQDKGQSSFVILRDITEHRNMEQSFQEQEQFIHATIDGLSAHICVIDSQGKIVITNRAWKNFAADNGADATKCSEGANYFAACRATRKNGEAKFGALVAGVKAVLNHELPEYVMEYACPSPELNRWFSGRVNAFSISGQNYAVISHVDVSELKRIQEEINCLNAELEQRIFERTSDLEAAIREQEAFSYSVSHDLRAPLRHINSFSAILLEDYGPLLPAEGLAYLNRITGATRGLGELIDHLLELSRVGRTALNLESVDLSGLAREIAKILQETEPQRCAEFFIEDNVVALGDRTLLQQLLENLFGNAWKYSSGRPVTRIEFGRTFATGEESLFVQDNGVGFDMAYSGNLFKIFQRLHGPEFEGTGIGLATAQRIIKRHGGSIWGEGRVGRGATFYFTLPVHY